MKVSICCVLLVGAVAWASSSRGEERIPLLTVGSNTYTNVDILDLSGAHLFIRHAGGLSTINMDDLDPKLQAKLGYDPAKARAQELANESWAKGSQANTLGGVKTNAVGAPCPPTSGRRTRTYSLRDTGDLTLYFPYVWKDSIQQTPPGSPPAMAIRFDREIADNFLVLISSVGKGSRIKEMGVVNSLTMVGNRALAGSVEKAVTLEQIQGEQTDGYYFILTDKNFVEGAHKPGKYKYQIQGLINLGDLMLNFVICSNFLDTPDQRAALAMIASARFTPK